MTRRLLNFLTVVSLLLFAAVAALWVRHYALSMYDEHAEPLWIGAEGERQLHFTGGVLRYEVWVPAPAPQLPSASRVRSSSGRRLELRLEFPAAIALVAFAIPPLAWSWRRARTRRRRRGGFCPSCAYDLTGNESGVCPECGSPR